jgi:hypothetical protein
MSESTATAPAVDPRPEFLFVIPVFSSVYPSAFANFLTIALSAASREHERYRFAVHVPERELLHSAMNKAVQLALHERFAGIIMFDDDCYPPFDAVSRLLRHYESGYDIVCGMGYMRGYPFTTTIGRYFEEGVSLMRDPKTQTLRLTGFEWVDDVSNEPPILTADFAGFPIAMVTRRALLKMTPPWFGTAIDGAECTHDVFFGDRAKKAGLQLYVDRTIDCGHLLNPQILTSANRDFARASAAANKAPKP